jgi:hypothetical protein
VYSSGILLINWVAVFSVFPVISQDMEQFVGGGNYQNYDAHFVPVFSSHHPNSKVIHLFCCLFFTAKQKCHYIVVLIMQKSFIVETAETIFVVYTQFYLCLELFEFIILFTDLPPLQIWTRAPIH